jgi:hypothetical protein
MNYRNILAVTLLVVVVGVFSLLQSKPWQVIAGTGATEGMTSTSTTYLADNTVLCNGQGVLGSIIGHGAHSGYLWVVDATSTTHTDFATTSALLAEMPTGYASTTVEYGVQAKRGLVVDYTGTGTTTITYRCGI